MVLFNCNCLSLGIALVYKFVNISAGFFVGLSVCYNCFRSTVLFSVGFPEHMPFGEFRRRFDILAPSQFRNTGPVLDEKKVSIA